MKKIHRVAVGLALLPLSSAFVGTASAAPVVTCGQVITTTTTLTNNVGPCSGTGIVIGADNITLNLNGKKISGNFDEGAGGEFAGVEILEHSGVTVTGGRPTRPGVITGFEAGVTIDGGVNLVGGNTLSNLRVMRNVGPDTTDAVLGDGIVVFTSPNNRILNNTLSRNGRYDGIGVLGFGSDNNLIKGNNVNQTSLITNAGQTGLGIILNAALFDPSPTPSASIFDNQVVGNTVRANGGSGVSNRSNVNGLITGNVVEDNGSEFATDVGIGVTANQLATQTANALVSGNTVRGHETGIDVISEGNRVLNNEVTGAAQTGLRAIGDANTISSNEIHDNSAYQALLTQEVSGGEISDNVILNNGFGNGLGFSIGLFITFGSENAILRNEVHGNAGAGITLIDTTMNDVRDNDAADNMVAPTEVDIVDLMAADLVDFAPDCDANTWFGNIWGSGGYNQDCVTIGGSGPLASAPLTASSPSSSSPSLPGSSIDLPAATPRPGPSR